ncbi:uncharacterized protein LOC132838428 [Tachysurus vachellii]|uniref:uncharacterized protein LOC132838428 n=1 Tax=Tachysurus vachellii TaxID=175792 RepID=UPI00296AFADA|nr:uncharacterized protein LOC132838428 [Tachysurus vachellii]
MLWRVYWLLLLNLAVNISAETVYSYASQYGSKPGNFTEAESTPVTSEPVPQEVSCSGVKGQGSCFGMVSRGASYDPSFKAAISSGGASQDSRNDAYGSVFASYLNSSPSVSGSKNMQPVDFNKNAEYEPSTPRVVSYGSVYRLLKPLGAYSSTRSALSTKYKPPISRSVTSSKTAPVGQNGYQTGYSQDNYATTHQGDAYNSMAATYYSRNKPSLKGMVISSGPIITFIMPNQSNEQLVQTIDKAQHKHEPGAPIKPSVAVDQPTAEPSKPFEHSQGLNYQRFSSQLKIPSHSKCHPHQSVIKPVTAPKPYLASPLTPESRATEPSFIQVGNADRPADTNNKSSIFFKAAQSTYMQQTTKPVKSSQQLADFSQDVYDSTSTTVSLPDSVYRFTRPKNVYGTSESIRTSAYEPSSSAKTAQSNYMQQLYQAGPSFSKVDYSSPSSAVTTGDSRHGFAQSGNGYGSADNAYTLHSLTTASSSNLLPNPYIIARHDGRSYPMIKPLQPNYKYFPTRYTQMGSVKDFDQLKTNLIPQMSDQAVKSEGFQTWQHYGSLMVSDSAQNSDFPQKNPQRTVSKPLDSIHSHPYKPKNLFNYLSSLPLPDEQSISRTYNQLQTGQSKSANLTTSIQKNYTAKQIWGYYSPASLLLSQGRAGVAMPRSVSDPASGYVVDQTGHPSGVLVKPSQQIFRSLTSSPSSPESQPVSPRSWYGPSHPDSGFALRDSRPLLQSGKDSFSPTQNEHD